MGELLQDLARQVGPSGLLVRLLGLLEAVIDGQPLGVGQEDILAELARVLLGQQEGLVPVVQLHMQLI